MKKLKASGGHERTSEKNRWNCVGWILFLCYIAGVFGVTLIHRGSYFGKCIYPLFYSYKSAWYHFLKNEWQNLVYNIILFLPYGILLPLLRLRMRRWWKPTAPVESGKECRKCMLSYLKNGMSTRFLKEIRCLNCDAIG